MAKALTNNKDLIRRFLVEQLGKPKKIHHIDDGDNLIENGMIDSMGIMQLVAYLETKFGVTVRDEDIIPDHFETVDSIYSYIERLHRLSEWRHP